MLIKYIRMLDEESIENLYNETFGLTDTNKKVGKIVEGLKPFITYLYFQMGDEQLDQLFKCKLIRP